MQRVLLANGLQPIGIIKGFRLGTLTVITTTPSSVYTPPVDCRWLLMYCIGKGGRGPGIGNATAGQIILCGGGGGGALSIASMAADVSRSSGFTCAIGAAGTGNPTSVTLASGAVICQANAGTDASGTLATGTAEAFAPGGVAGVVNANSVGDLMIPGNPGEMGHRVSGTVGKAGDGGNGPLGGGGGQGKASQGQGGAGGKYGAGGGGNISINAGGSTLASTAGVGAILFYEYY